jgi:hypothetical protein
MPINAEKPRAQLEKWIRLLGWRTHLRMYRHVIDDDASSHLRREVITWYETGPATGGRDHFCLQINEAPQGQMATYEASVYAIRYRICTGWHRFRLYWTDEKLKREAKRLGEWLHRQWFASLEGRRRFRQAHPECAGYTWTKIRNEGPRKQHAGRTP